MKPLIDTTPPEQPMGTLIMTIGLPRSGKSSWAHKQKLPVVDLDAIRLAKTGTRWYGPAEPEVWAFAYMMIRSLFLAGHDLVILDSTNYCKEARDYFKGPWARTAAHLTASRDYCVMRAIANGYTELAAVITTQWMNWEPITKEEDIG